MPIRALEGRWLVPAALIAGLLAFAPPARALDPTRAVTQYVLQTWYAKDGLPQNSVHAIYQSPDGYLWFGTEEGLARYDGSQFLTFDHKSGALRHNYVASLVEARDGGFWIGTLNGGLTHYKEGVFTQRGQELGPGSNTVGPILERANGDLWVGTVGGGLTLLRNGHAVHYTKDQGLPGNNVRCLEEDPDGGLWIGTDQGLTSFRNGAFTTYTTKEGLPDNLVMYAYRDRRGALWISTLGGLSRYQDGRFTNFTTKNGLPSNQVGAIREDRDGNLWIGTSAGLCRYTSRKFATLTTRDGLSGDQVVAIYEDGEGSLWVGTFGGGLTRLIDGKFMTVTKREGLGEDAVGPIFQSQDGAIWIGTMGGGVSRIQNGKMTTFRSKQGLASDYVDAICQDRTGCLWFGTSTGLTRLDHGRFRTLTKKDGLAGMTIMTLAEDRDGALWIGYGAAGLDRMKDGKVTHYTKADGLAHDSVRSLFVDKDGALWIGTFGGGVNRFRDGKFTTFSTRNGLPHDVVGRIVQDVRGSIWLCTIGGGLIRYRDGVFKQITTRDGLFDDTIYALLEDNQGNFWMSCNNGISRVSHFDLDAFCDGTLPSVKALPFGENDGMRNRECNYASPPGLKAQDGTLWFPTLGGVAAIDPARIRFNRVPPPVIIESALGDQRPLARTAEARIRPGKGELEFHYAALSYIAPSRVRFRYRLEGYDKQWVEAGTRRVAYYTNIPPGRYTFRVTACNNDGVWSRAGTTFALTLEPHFYQTWLFYCFGVALLGFLVVFLHRSRVRRLEQRTRELRDLVDERTRAQEALGVSNRKLEKALEDLQHAQETLVQQERLRALGQMASGVTHDFNNALTPILGFTDFLLSRPQILDDREKTLTYLTNVNTAARDASQVVKRLREFYRPRDEAEVFPLVAIDAILNQAVSLTQPKWKDQAQVRGISIDIETELGPTPLIPGSESALREMLTNMIFNAVDAMPHGGRITLRSRCKSDQVVIEVVDTGTGMTEEVRGRCLEPFFTTKGDEGTGLGLPMVYGIARRHGGAIEIESAPGRGTTFRVRLPVEPSAVLGEQTTIGSRARPGVPPLRVLAVDDEERIRSLVYEYLIADGHDVVTAEDGLDGLEKLRTGRFELVITDRSMPRMSGDQLAAAAKRLDPDLPILLLTGFGEMMAQEQKPPGVDLIVSKPVTSDALRDAIATLVAARRPAAA